MLYGLYWSSGSSSSRARWDPIWGILGMLAGAALYMEVYPALKKTVQTWGDFGKITLILSVNHWFIIVVFVLGGLLLFRWFDKKGL